MPAAETSPLVTDRQRLPCLAFGPFAFDRHTRLLRRGGSGSRAAAARARRPRAAARTAPARSSAAGADRRRLEGRVRHRHVARRSHQRPAAGARRRPAVADLHPDAPPARLPLRSAGIDGRDASRSVGHGTSRGAGHRATRLPFHRWPARAVERGGHLCAAGDRGGLGTDSESTGRVAARGALHRHAGAGNRVRRISPRAGHLLRRHPAGVVGLRRPRMPALCQTARPPRGGSRPRHG